MNKKLQLDEDMHNAWCWFEQECLYAKSYNLLPMMSAAAPGLAPANPIIDRLLPSLLLIKAFSLFDEALKRRIASTPDLEGVKTKDLNDRIELLGQRRDIRDVETVHQIRKKRNILAHEHRHHSTWDELAGDIIVLREVLQEMGVIGEVPEYQVVGERSALREAESDPNALWERTVSVYVKANDRKVSEISFTQKIMKEDA